METQLQPLLTTEQFFSLIFDTGTNMSDYTDRVCNCQTVIVFGEFCCN
jgi:hypothetical protein